jgi:hypothetical protein
VDDSGPASIAAVGRRGRAGGRLGARFDRRRGPAAAGRRTTRARFWQPPWAGGGGPADDSGPLLAAVWA